MEDKIKASWDGLTPDREKAQEHLTGEVLAASLAEYGEETLVSDGEVRIPRWQLTVRAEVAEIKENTAMLYFRLSSPKWGQELFECSVGVGSTPKNAMGMAAGSFLFSMMDGICCMEKDWEPRRVKTEFAGRPHWWKVYKSNIVGMGDSPQKDDCPDYWGELEEDILKRIGNQKLCYVKLYGAKNGGDITGECRINDVCIDQLSRRMGEIVERWDTEEFGSHKQFLFLLQDQETTCSYPFTEEELAEHTLTAVRMFHDCDTQEEYDAFPHRLESEIGDSCLAQELFAFLPEMCAENAFDKISYPDEMAFSIGDRTVTAFKTQLASYYPIQKALFDGFRSGAFSPWENEVFSRYISVSSTYNVICRAKEQGADLEADGGRISLSYGMNQDYELR